MIDNIRTGQNIAAHRQRLGWTQGELAGRLNVTHQAVSKWENGVAFPDISTLYALSQLFGVSMELLLTGESPVPNHAPTPPEQPEQPAPPSPEETLAQEDAPAADASAYDWDEIISLAPFASRETLDRLIEQCEASCDREHITTLAPFISRHTLDRLIGNGCSCADWDFILSLAPFASRDTLDALVASCETSCDRSHLTALAPFLSHATLDRLIRSNLDHADWDFILSLAPFASRDTLDALVASCETSCDRGHLTALAPFLSHATLDRLILGKRKKTDAPAEQSAVRWAEEHEKQMEAAARRAEIHEREMERAARRAERHAERMAEQLEKKLTKHAEKAVQKAEEYAQAISHNRCSDERRTQIVPADPPAGSLDEYAERIVSLLYEACGADEPFNEQLEDLRNALLDQDYPALNEFAALLDAYIGSQWLEEYAVLCEQAAPDEDLLHRLELALSQRNWHWIEDHAHLITDSEMIRRIVLVSTTEGYFEFVPLFIDQLDQHSIDSAARQAVRLNRTEDILPFSDRISPGLL